MTNYKENNPNVKIIVDNNAYFSNGDTILFLKIHFTKLYESIVLD